MKRCLSNQDGYGRTRKIPCSRGKLREILSAIFTVLMIMTSVASTYAQANVISGVVTDEKRVPVPGVNVKVKGTTIGTTTDTNGQYKLNVPATSTLVFSFVGFTDQEVIPGKRTTVNIQLSNSSTSLNEVVVVGYGTQQKKDLTGAISIVKAKDITKRQATTVAEALQGQAAGIKVRGGGQPGSEAQIQVRGLKNLSGTNPLYVIDGLISEANRDFNPNDIESIQILKDASAAAIYGSRAANGVVIITTKKGKSGAMRVEVSAKAGIQTTPRYKLTQTDEFTRLNYMAYDNAGVPRQNLQLENNTDWQDVAFRKGNIQDYSASFSGGGDNGSYLVSGGYFTNKGTVISTDFNRINFRVNTQGRKGIFTIGENVAISKAKSNEMSGNPYIDVIRMIPTIPVYDPANPGGYGYGSDARARTFGTNPLAVSDLDDRTNDNLRIRGNLFAELQFLPYLKARTNIGIETSNDHYKHLRKLGNWTANQPADRSQGDENMAQFTSGLIENTLNFNKSFGKHVVSVIGGQSYQRTNYQQISGSKRDILVINGHYYDVLDQGVSPLTGGYRLRTDLISYFGRAEYSFDDKYLFNAVFRTDGSSKFGPDYKFGSYPSVSAAWRVSKEEFFKVGWINDLKLRASYGTLGSNNIGEYEYRAVVNTNPTAIFGTNQTLQPGGIQVQLTNPDLHWEKVTQQNYGFDASFLNNKLNITAEYFNSQTDDVLSNPPISIFTGNDGGNPRVNNVSLNNKGYEITISYRENKTAFAYGGSFNFTKLNNKVTSLGLNRNPIYVGNTVTNVNQPIGMWFVLQTDGIFQSQQEVDSYKNAQGKVIQPTSKPGDIRFKDNNGDGQITNDDKAIVGSPWPTYEMGLNLNASYKGFDLSMDWFASVGAKVYNGPRSVMEGFSDNSNYPRGIQPWTPDNTNTSTPRAIYATSLNSRFDTDRWLESGSFARLKYIGLSYNLPQRWAKRAGIATAQITISAQNLITITKYKGLDPEFSNSSIYEKGFDYGAFPNLRTVSLGFNLGL